jgi:hypothetical protein
MSTQKSRADRIAASVLDGDEPDALEQSIRDLADSTVDGENQQYWALYRALDVSQSDVGDLVDAQVETSQSTVSRVIREKETQVLHDGDALDLVGTLDETHVDAAPEDWQDAYRDTLAEAKADVLALEAIRRVDTPTPEWAARRFPELVGCHKAYAQKANCEGEIADDSHLNRLDSVNTDRWD